MTIVVQNYLEYVTSHLSKEVRPLPTTLTLNHPHLPVFTLNQQVFHEMKSKESNPVLQCSKALFSNQLCGFRKPKST